MILTDEQLEQFLIELAEWRIKDEKLFRVLRFQDFNKAIEFMNQVAITAEVMDHHPEWSNVYNKVEIYLVTHSEGGITQLDIDLAREIDSHFSAFKL
ncbi:4a-hydroxytetrahydrobiopterin dehydratase [Candidatus Pseudothioglobus singularis]|nr:4a-hydroxytetrahydrobiopterin dehydratase [Candidatus Pseudothioglobus singularis]MDC0491989.1 4a-hydroxytetrahydrobiopterin dehydratase [Candidatus Pseudothioglobus singularis]